MCVFYPQTISLMKRPYSTPPALILAEFQSLGCLRREIVFCSLQTTELGRKSNKRRILDAPDLQQPPAAAVAAVEAAAALLAAEIAGSRTDDAVSRLAEAGPGSMRLLLRLEQGCRPGNENLADSMLQHLSSTASRQAAFQAHQRPALANRLADLRSHVTASSISASKLDAMAG